MPKVQRHLKSEPLVSELKVTVWKKCRTSDFQFQLFCQRAIFRDATAPYASMDHWSKKGTYTGRGRIALLPFWALFWVRNPFCNRDFWKALFPCTKYQFLPCFEASWPFYWTICQFHAHLSWDFCQKSHRQSVFCEIFGATCQFSHKSYSFVS